MQNRFLRVIARHAAIPVCQRLLHPAFAGLPRKLGQMLGRAPLPPQRVVLKTEDWARENPANKANYKELSPAEVIERTKARPIQSNGDWRMELWERVNNPPKFVVTLPQGRVIGPSGAVITGDDVLLADLSPDWFFKPKQHPLFWRIKLPEAKELRGTYVTLARLSGWNYAHWVLELLPRLKLIEQAGVDLSKIDGIILNGPKNGWKSEMLDLLGIPEKKRIYLNAGDHLQCETLLAPSYVCAPDGFQRWMVDYLQTAFPVDPAKTKSKARIYIARNKAGYRHVLNEREVICLLERFGFKHVYCEELSFREKVELFSSAEAVVAGHGAGLIHLAFCQPGTTVLEILSPDYVNSCFWSLSDAARLNYRYMLGAGQQPPKGRDPHCAEKDILVDLPALEKALKGLRFE